MNNSVSYKDDANEKIKMAIMEMIFRDEYWGYLFSMIQRKMDYNLKYPMGVSTEINGTISLYYNPLFIKMMDIDLVKIIIEHEGIHILNDHIPRRLRIISDEPNIKQKNTKLKKWNIAADCAVNSLIRGIKDKYIVDGSVIEPIFSKSYNLPERETAEFYYNNIKSNENDSNNDEQELENIDSENCNDKNGLPKKTNVDDHNLWINKNVADIRSLASRIEEYSKDLVMESYKSVRNRGKIPGYIEEKINELLSTPKIPYYQLIAKLVKASRLTKYRRAYTRLNKKRIYSFFINENKTPAISPFPGKTKDFSFIISVLLDTSGSMRIEDIHEGLSAIKNIIENDKSCITHVVECDTEVQNEYIVKKISDIKYNPKGRGGTTLFPGLERCKQLNTDVTLVFTDGYCETINSIPKSMLPNKIIYIINSNGQSENLNLTGHIVKLKE